VFGENSQKAFNGTKGRLNGQTLNHRNLSRGSRREVREAKAPGKKEKKVFFSSNVGILEAYCLVVNRPREEERRTR